MKPSNNRKPIKYIEYVDIRFADLDLYGHVNSKHYVDLVFTARLKFTEKALNTSLAEVAKSGLGFFLTKSTINYKRPITGLQRIQCTSYVSEVKDSRILVIPFVIASEDGEKTFSDGILEFAVIDMKTTRSTVVSDYVLDLLFEPAGQI